MQPYNPEEPLFSVHIPKCAGTSFSKVLSTWFGEGYLLHYHNEAKGLSPDKHNLYIDEEGGKFRSRLCIHGHFTYARGNGVLDYYSEARQLITVVRDPFDLHLSNFFYVQRLHKQQGLEVKRNRKVHPIIEKGWSLEDYLSNAKYSYIRNFFPLGINLDNYEDVLGEQFIHIGVAEDLQGSVDTLSDILGFKSINVPQVNVSNRNESIPNGAKAEFEANNPLEVAIYEYALKKYKNKSIEQRSKITPQRFQQIDCKVNTIGFVNRNAAIYAKNEEIFFYKDIIKNGVKNSGQAIKGSFSYKISRAITYPARFLKRLLNKNG